MGGLVVSLLRRDGPSRHFANEARALLERSQLAVPAEITSLLPAAAAARAAAKKAAKAKAGKSEKSAKSAKSSKPAKQPGAAPLPDSLLDFAAEMVG